MRSVSPMSQRKPIASAIEYSSVVPPVPCLCKRQLAGRAKAFPGVADLVAAVTIHQLLHGAIDRKAAWLLSRWEVPEGGQELAHYRLRGTRTNKCSMNHLS